MDMTLFSDRSFAAGCAMVGLQNLGMYALLFQLPYLLKLLYQWGPERSGHFMTTFMVSMMAASALGGRVAEKIGVRATCVTGSLVSVAGLYWLSLLTPAKDELHIIGGLVLAGAGLGLASGWPTVPHSPRHWAPLTTGRAGLPRASSLRAVIWAASSAFPYSDCCYPRPIPRNPSPGIIRRSWCLPDRSWLRQWCRY